MRRSKIKELFGMKYVYNTRSKQIHKVDNLQESCHFKQMKNGVYCTKRKAIKLITKGDRDGIRYDGCVHCWKEMNNHGKNNVCK